MAYDRAPTSDGPAPDKQRACRSCGGSIETIFVDLGMAPLCEDFLTADALVDAETFYPQDVRICSTCLLVQLPTYVSAERIFSEYAYFSSYSDSWVAHAERFVVDAIERAGLGPDSRVVEIASNDGYLLQHVVAQGIPALGIEPATNIAEVATKRGIPTRNAFFSEALATEVRETFGPADLIVANNVFAHVPNLNDFTAGMAALLGPGGLISIEVAHLASLIEHNEFDTIYHEHFMYYTARSARSVLARHGLRLFDVELLPTHGGSLRLWAVHDDDPRGTSGSVARVLADEAALGLDHLEGYAGFAERVAAIKRDLLEFLIEERRKGSLVVGYGAPGKGNTLLNYCGIRTDLVAFVVDRNPYKWGRFTPGTHIPIHPPERLIEARPDVVLIMAWNLRDEITGQLRDILPPGTRLAVAIPGLEVVEIGDVLIVDPRSARPFEDPSPTGLPA